jgi:hypothetical protein
MNASMALWDCLTPAGRKSMASVGPMATLIAAWHRGAIQAWGNLNRMVEKHDIVRYSCHLDLLASAVQATSGIFANYMLW